FLGKPLHGRADGRASSRGPAWKASCGSYGPALDGKIYQNRSLHRRLVGEDYKSGPPRAFSRKLGSADCASSIDWASSASKRPWPMARFHEQKGGRRGWQDEIRQGIQDHVAHRSAWNPPG